jgi:MoaA/NifB/PqqE/SkfB family radical SAM enzyme
LNLSRRRFKKVYLEISNGCNLTCSFCPQSSLVRPAAHMDEALFEKVVAELAPTTRLFCLHVMGEPLRHPQIRRFLEILGQHGSEAAITSNGTLMSPEHQAALLHPAVRQVNLSLQSFRGSFGEDKDDSVYLSRILAFCDRAAQERPELNVNLRFWNGSDPAAVLEINRVQLDTLRRHFALGDDALRILSPNGNLLRGRQFLHLSPRFEWPSLEGPEKHRHGTCRGGRDMLAILADGRVSPCCMDAEGIIDLGDAKKNSCAEILAAPRASALIEGFRRHELSEDLCRRCEHAQRF